MFKRSILLSIYLFLASIYYLFTASVRYVIFAFLLLVVLYIGLRIRNKKVFLKIHKKFFLGMSCIFGYTLVVQLINGTLTPFTIYYLTSPILGYFIFSNRFNTRYVSFPFYIFCFYLLTYFILHKNLIGVLNGTVSENYVSIILIMNIATIYVIKYKQKEVIPILPALLAVFFSILAIGRSGILTTLLIFLLVLWLRIRYQKRLVKMGLFITFIVPIIAFAIANWDSIKIVFENIEVFSKFSKDGVSSPSRGIIQRAYLSNIDIITFFTGYNYEDNYWFQHYGLNPHNSYIRLHYFSGLAFFVIIPIVITSLIKLIREEIFLSGIFFSILVRSYTDSVLFLTLFDFVPVLFIMVALLSNNNIEKNSLNDKECLYEK
ncbi:conserved membrane protein. Putative O-antigen biosynthesis protein [Tenacibaculum maritimum]|nr:conserved membrane protein. Putative O-antigen biosynthesis protein [Tenacibaculum maritimum]